MRGMVHSMIPGTGLGIIPGMIPGIIITMDITPIGGGIITPAGIIKVIIQLHRLPLRHHGYAVI